MNKKHCYKEAQIHNNYNIQIGLSSPRTNSCNSCNSCNFSTCYCPSCFLASCDFITCYTMSNVNNLRNSKQNHLYTEDQNYLYMRDRAKMSTDYDRPLETQVIIKINYSCCICIISPFHIAKLLFYLRTVIFL